jgi:hypothetical protein
MKFFKWGGPAVALLLVATWWFSGRTWIAHVGPGDWQVSVGSGRVSITYWPGRTAQTQAITGAPPPKGLQAMNTPRQFNWWFRIAWEPDRRFFAIPLWFPFLIVVGLTTAAWRQEILARRRALLGHCPECHYDRTGLAASAPCPECGTTIVVA